MKSAKAIIDPRRTLISTESTLNVVLGLKREEGSELTTSQLHSCFSFLLQLASSFVLLRFGSGSQSRDKLTLSSIGEPSISFFNLSAEATTTDKTSVLKKR